MNSPDDSRLIDSRGRPRFGLYFAPPALFNLEDFRPYGAEAESTVTKKLILRYRIKRWEYLGFCNDDIICGLAVVHLGYMCNLFAYLYERHRDRMAQFNIITLGGGAASFDGTSLEGAVTFSGGKSLVRVVSNRESVTIEGSVKGELCFGLSFQKYREPLVCLTRVGLGGFNYTHKEAGCPVVGTITLGNRSWKILEEESFGMRDYTLGYLARHTFWNWASGGGFDRQGNRVGFNCVQGLNETGFTENAFWINGRLFKADVVDFRYDDRNLMMPWRVESNDGRVRLRFMPAGKRSADTRTGLVTSRFFQPFGSFQGELRSGDEIWELDRVAGFTEEHCALW